MIWLEYESGECVSFDLTGTVTSDWFHKPEAVSNAVSLPKWFLFTVLTVVKECPSSIYM